MPHYKVLDYYASNPVDVFINTSSSEGLPVSIMEAMSFGIPVIATDVGGTKEIVNDKNGNLLNAIDTPERIGSVIVDFSFKRKSEKDKMREAARKKWENEFDAKKNCINFPGKLSILTTRK